MTDYQIQPHTRRCAVTGRELRAGEKYYTALLEEGDRFVRKDYAGEAWQGPPEHAFGYWCGKVPVHDGPRPQRFDEDLLVDCFHRLEGETDPGRLSFRYVVALLLMRRKRLKFVEARRAGEQEVLHVSCSQSGAQYQVINPQLTEEQMAQVQGEVFKVLGWNP